jgi:CRP/FNR family cyclic AMP-dependent transcriptional regulator
MGTATAIKPTTVLVIEKKEMVGTFHEEHKHSDCFISYLLTRNIRVEEDLLDQLLNSTEKRLARGLLLLARYGKHNQPQMMLSQITQEALAEMVDTTGSRVNIFMNELRKVGSIHCYGGLHIHNSLLSVVLHEL